VININNTTLAPLFQITALAFLLFVPFEPLSASLYCLILFRVLLQFTAHPHNHTHNRPPLSLSPIIYIPHLSRQETLCAFSTNEDEQFLSLPEQHRFLFNDFTTLDSWGHTQRVDSLTPPSILILITTVCCFSARHLTTVRGRYTRTGALSLHCPVHNLTTRTSQPPLDRWATR
jgi:hypothetical protein